MKRLVTVCTLWVLLMAGGIGLSEYNKSQKKKEEEKLRKSLVGTVKELNDYIKKTEIDFESHSLAEKKFVLFQIYHILQKEIYNPYLISDDSSYKIWTNWVSYIKEVYEITSYKIDKEKITPEEEDNSNVGLLIYCGSTYDDIKRNISIINRRLKLF